MNVPPVVQRHPSLRWLAPAAVVGVAGLVATGMFRATASSEALPETTPAELIAAVRTPQVDGFSGTVVSHLSLGLPELPTVAGSAGGTGVSMVSLLTGSHTLQVWYGGADKQRIALLGATDETDLFRSGREVWQWSSADHVAVHTVLPGTGARSRTPAATLTPSALAQTALADLDPSTRVTVQKGRRVAERNAYELILRPRSRTTRVGSVHIAVDGKTKIALGVQVYARGSHSASVDVAFTSIRFARPSDVNFRFNPPTGAEIRTVDLGKAVGLDNSARRTAAAASGTPARNAPLAGTPLGRHLSTAGAGWSTVYGYRVGTPVRMPRGVLKRATEPVGGTWGHGRLIESNLICALITDDGRIYAGAVDPSALYAAAGAK